MFHIVVYDDKSYIRNRLRGILNHADIRIHEATNMMQLLTLVDDESFDTNLIMADLNFDNPPDVENFKQFKQTHKSVPLVFYTSYSSRRAFVTAVRIGASDFILKSTEDNDLIERIRKHLETPAKQVINTTHDQMISMDIHHFIAGEIRKAQKGQYSLTLCFSTFMNKAGSAPANVQLNANLLQSFENAYWETDVMMSYGPNSFISILPFCGPEGKTIVESKLQSISRMLAGQEIELQDTQLVNEYVTFPNDGLTRDEILMTMEQKMNV